MNGPSRSAPSSAPIVSNEITAKKSSGLPGMVARIYWMMVGHAVLAVLAMSLFKSGQEIGSWTDLAYLANVTGLLAVRYLDITRLGGSTADGQEASLTTWRRFAAAAVGFWTLVWIVVHL